MDKIVNNFSTASRLKKEIKKPQNPITQIANHSYDLRHGDQ